MKLKYWLIASFLIPVISFSCDARKPEHVAGLIHDGDVVLATNPQVEQFLTEVDYPEHDYSFTKLFNYSPVSPGKADKPSAYAIKWKSSRKKGPVSAILKEGDWSQEFTFPAGSSYWTISNLRPGAQYTYKVSYGDGEEITGGSFTTTGHLHQLFFDSSVRNSRDLGGWTTKDGKTVKYRKIYRGGRLEQATLSEEGKRDLLAEGIRAHLDLRGTSDVPTECILGTGDEYAFCTPLLEHSFLNLFKDHGDKVKDCFEFIVKSLREDKPVYYNCSLGRDRTGSLTVILLGLLNVDEGDISKEYELTQFAPHGWATSGGETVKLSRIQAYKDGAGYLWDNFVTEGENFADGIEKFLLANGVCRKDIDDFRSMMLE